MIRQIEARSEAGAIHRALGCCWARSGNGRCRSSRRAIVEMRPPAVIAAALNDARRSERPVLLSQRAGFAIVNECDSRRNHDKRHGDTTEEHAGQYNAAHERVHSAPQIRRPHRPTERLLSTKN
jgi:hypothetical protein